jgi:flagellar motor switch protein FliG
MLTNTPSARDRAVFLLQALDSELREELGRRCGRADGALLEDFCRIASQYDAGNVLELVEPLEDAAPAYLLLLAPEQASAAFARLDEKKQVDLVGEMLRLTPERFLAGLGRMAAKLSQEADAFDPVRSAADLLNQIPRKLEQRCLAALDGARHERADALRKALFLFEDLTTVNDKGIQAVLKEVEADDLVLALKTASDTLKEKVFKNMSRRAAESIQEKMTSMGPARVADVEAMQQRIVRIALRLEAAGHAIIQDRPGGEEEVV